MLIPPLRVALLALLVPLVSSVASAANYVTGFEEFTASQTLSGQTRLGFTWDTNNYSAGADGLEGTLDDLGQSDYAGPLLNYSVGSEYWAALGGLTQVAPVVRTSFLWAPVDSTGAQFLDFSVRFAITYSATKPMRDTFGWTFRNGAGNQVLRVGFVPHPTQTDLLNIRVYDSQDLPLPLSGSPPPIGYNSKYDLHVSVSSSNKVTVTFADVLGNPPLRVVYEEVLPGTGLPVAGSIHDVAATWTVADNLTVNLLGERTNFGSNTLVFNNYSLHLRSEELPTSYLKWKAFAFNAAPATDSTAVGDPDNDGFSNNLEYIMGTDPLISGADPIRSFRFGTLRHIDFYLNAHAGDVGYQILGGNSLSNAGSWTPVAYTLVNQTITADGNRWLITVRPFGLTGNNLFYRIKFNRTEP